MKKLLLTIAMAAMTLAGCTSNVDMKPVNTQRLPDFYAEIAPDTRTQLVDNQSDNTSYAAWVDGEFISIFYLSNPNNQYKVCDISNEGKNARFTPTGIYTDVADADYKEFSKHYAMYPYSEDNKMFEEGVITSILPATQSYNPDSNLSYVPMVASSENTSLSFVIPTSLMRISVSRNNPLRSTLKQIILSSEGGDIPLAGELTFDMRGATVVTTVNGTETSIVLDLGAGLDITTEQRDYYISLPSVTFPADNAMSLTLVYTQGGVTKQFVKTWSGKELVFDPGDRKHTSITLSLEDFNGSTAYPASGGELVGNLTLTTDMNIEQPLTVPAGEEATVNLNGKDITAGLFAESNGTVTEGDTDSYAFWVKEGAKLTINGEGDIRTGACTYSMAVWAQGGEVVINGGYYENDGEGSDLIYASAGGVITINGGEFKACMKQSGVEGTAEMYSVLNLKDNSGSKIIVKGGKFHNFDPANNASEGPGTNFVAEGYISVETSEGVWEVLPAAETIEVATAAALESVLAQGGKATLVADITLEQTVTIASGKSASIDLNGHNIVNESGNTELSYFDIFFVEEGAALTINGEGNVEAVSGIEGYCVFAEGDVVINGGSYTSGVDAAGATNACIYARGNGSVTINDGEFKSADGAYVLNLKDADRATASITVYGGKYHNFDPANNASEGAGTNFVAEGYISVETSEGAWEVVPANEPIEVATAAALESVLAQGGEATLTADINLENTAIVITEGEATINLNGKTITGGLFTESSGAITEGNSDSYAFWVKGGTLNIKGDGNVKSQFATYSMAVWADGGSVNIYGGNFYNYGHGCDLIYAKNGGIVNIYGGYFEACKSDHTEDGTLEEYSALNLHGTYPGTITVYGGKFYKFDPANNKSENPAQSFVAEGKTSTQSGDYFIVQ